ncbi:MAG TPA: BamA/TamA family outer membrane protein [Vicinamibacterales bacterium]|nr:BamA/TamA family outer membrane protein [Vicinamibacterales bacterium]
MTACAAAAGCRESGVAVASLAITGNVAFTDAALEAQLATRSPGLLARLLPWSRPEPFDRKLFEADLDRLEAFYADRGYPDARVTRGDVQVSPDGRRVNLTIEMNEGEPVRIDRVEIGGLADLPPAVAAAAQQITIAPGDLYDRARVLEARDNVARALRDRGYPNARVTSRVLPAAEPRRVALALDVAPGEAANFGPVQIVGLSNVSEGVVRRTLTFRPGEPYSEGKLLESERRLFALGLFDFAHVASDQHADASDEAQPVTVTVKEGKPTTLRVGAGYGSEDGPRGSFEWQHLNAFGRAQQFMANAKYSRRLAGGEVNLVQPYIARGQSLGSSGHLWWRDEPSFTSRSIGAEGRWLFQLGADRGPSRPPLIRHARLTYSAEQLEYTIAAETRADPLAVQQLIALGIDPTTGRGSGRLTEVSVLFEQSVFDQIVDPHRGYGFSASAGHAAPWLGGTFRFNEVKVQGSVHVPIGPLVWATRTEAGAILANAPSDVPFSSRYFLGGTNSLRGWSRFEVSPVATDGIPIGGLAMFEVSSELRVPIMRNIGAVGFIDAGNVWLDPAALRLGDLRSDIGIGVRYVASFGVFRADLGWQLTPIPGLIVNGEPQPHRWRIHFGLGHAF